MPVLGDIVCEWDLLPAPQRNQSVAVTGDDGTVYFTGYLAVSPMPEYAGLGMAGPVYRLELQAVSDEILLDTQLIPPSSGDDGSDGGAAGAGAGDADWIWGAADDGAWPRDSGEQVCAGERGDVECCWRGRRRRRGGRRTALPRGRSRWRRSGRRCMR